MRVLLVDDHELVRAGLRALLQSSELDVVGAAASGAEAVRLCAELAPDVVLMDLSMPGMDGAEATRLIRASCPDTQVVVLSSSSDGDRVWGALDAGAVGYLLKDSEPAQLRAALMAVGRDESPLDPRAARSMLETRRTAGPGVELTVREKEVLGLVARGLANKQVARRLGITERTVKSHLGSIFQRIGVSDRTSAALWAQRHLPGESVRP